ncbi:MAG: hypothetical protein WBB55_04220, partial [Anaerolineales bacterium]
RFLPAYCQLAARRASPSVRCLRTSEESPKCLSTRISADEHGFQKNVRRIFPTRRTLNMPHF